MIVKPGLASTNLSFSLLFFHQATLPDGDSLSDSLSLLRAARCIANCRCECREKDPKMISVRNVWRHLAAKPTPTGPNLPIPSNPCGNRYYEKTPSIHPKDASVFLPWEKREGPPLSSLQLKRNQSSEPFAVTFWHGYIMDIKVLVDIIWYSWWCSMIAKFQNGANKKISQR